MIQETSRSGLEQVVLRRGGQTFAFDVTIPHGVITCVCGASGSGKTTFLNLVAGFETPQQGRVLLDGADVTRLHPGERPVSLVFQENNLFAHLDLFTNIGLGMNPGLHLKEADRSLISRALARTGLSGFEKRLPGTLSGGERQRAAFARALVRNRPFLLLDEPFAALDPALKAQMTLLLQELQAENGVTVLLVTHDPGDIERLAHRVIFLDEGLILADESKSIFLARQSPPEIREFLGNR